jgi:hypothetical protein
MMQPNMSQMAQMAGRMRSQMMGGKFASMGEGGGGIGGRMPGAINPSAPGSSSSTPDLEPEEESNLVEVAFYGIASLYERFTTKKEGADVAAAQGQ